MEIINIGEQISSADFEQFSVGVYIFLPLRIRFRILNILKDHGLLGRMSANEIIFELSKI